MLLFMPTKYNTAFDVAFGAERIMLVLGVEF